MRRDSIDDMFDRMQNLFDEFQNKADLKGFRGMPVDIHEEDGKIIVKADLPGISKEDINLKADKNKIDVSAESSTAIQEENEKYFTRERTSRKFHRTVSWPAEIDPETVTAEYDDGVLTVTAEKTESEGKDVEIE
ncbi:Hsp20/alpha crystallin family protein [Candidatus Nanohalococcus occultus]|uniref:Hsp20/alpha crystallin family protein n=1 Tax=Candidatus Nanohalococcus occultus TaxID=2978047 RepID=UPI0039E0FDB6